MGIIKKCKKRHIRSYRAYLRWYNYHNNMVQIWIGDDCKLMACIGGKVVQIENLEYYI